jgi:high-affinity Fe2+/Pb2+ permease
MKYVVEMCSGAVIYIPVFMKIGSGIQKLMEGAVVETHRQQGDLISLLLFYKEGK